MPRCRQYHFWGCESSSYPSFCTCLLSSTFPLFLRCRSRVCRAGGAVKDGGMSSLLKGAGVITLGCSGDTLIANRRTVMVVLPWDSSAGLGGVAGIITTASSSLPPRTSGLVALLLLLLCSAFSFTRSAFCANSDPVSPQASVFLYVFFLWNCCFDIKSGLLIKSF